MTNSGADTSGTTPDAETGAEGDTNQLEQEDTLIDRGIDSVLDEGYSPPDHPPNQHRLETELEQYQGESLDQRLAQEEPENWDRPEPGARDTDRSGRLVEADPDASRHQSNDVAARDVGFDGGAATAEEAAMHTVDEDDLGGVTDD